MPQVTRFRDRAEPPEDEQLAEAADTIMADEPPAGPKPSTDAVPVDDASPHGPARHVELTILAQDPRFTHANGRIVRAKVQVASDVFRPPLQNQRFNVVSFDPVRGVAGPELTVIEADGRFVDQAKGLGDEALVRSVSFQAQNVFVIASRTLQAFEAALGRRVPWDFETHQLYLVPQAEVRANAGYVQGKRAVLFGIVPHPDGTTRYSCLSHDVVAHEVTHAILDGLRSGFLTPALPDQAAFHEGFADVVALLSVFAVPDVLDRALEIAFGTGPMTVDDASAKQLRESVLFRIAEQFGEEVHGRSGQPLRESLRLAHGDWWRTDPEYEEPHNRGEILVAAFAGTVLDMWFKRLKLLLEHGPAPRRLAAEEGAKSAEHLLRMAIRAIDYLPPLEFEFEDFLEAIVVADREIAPDDEHGYLTSVEHGFASFGIGFPPHNQLVTSTLKQPPDYKRFNFTALQSDRDEVFRFIWENEELLGISTQFSTIVESVRPAVRVGPDGFVVRETVVSYLQSVDGTLGELVALSERERSPVTPVDARLERPAGLEDDDPVRLYGGGALVFDQFGHAKYHQYKPLLDWPRQSKRLAYLVAHRQLSASTRLGQPVGSRVDPLAAAHRVEHLASERW